MPKSSIWYCGCSEILTHSSTLDTRDDLNFSSNSHFLFKLLNIVNQLLFKIEEFLKKMVMSLKNREEKMKNWMKFQCKIDGKLNFLECLLRSVDILCRSLSLSLRLSLPLCFSVLRTPSLLLALSKISLKLQSLFVHQMYMRKNVVENDWKRCFECRNRISIQDFSRRLSNEGALCQRAVSDTAGAQKSWLIRLH